jgi:hypothetical protein
MPFRDGDPNKGRDHTMHGAHDLALVSSAVRLSATRDGEKILAAVENVAAGHHFPTDERSRAADVFWRPVPPAVEDLTDNVEVRSQIDAAVADVHPNCFTYFRVHIVHEGSSLAVEDHVLRFSIEIILRVEQLQTFPPHAPFRVKLALHDIEFLVNRRKSAFGLYKDQPIHAMGHVQTRVAECTMIDK